eukprot:316649-Chlamydomonas_euryale.AAC.2
MAGRQYFDCPLQASRPHLCMSTSAHGTPGWANNCPTFAPGLRPASRTRWNASPPPPPTPEIKLDHWVQASPPHLLEHEAVGVGCLQQSLAQRASALVLLLQAHKNSVGLRKDGQSELRSLQHSADGISADGRRRRRTPFRAWLLQTMQIKQQRRPFASSSDRISRKAANKQCF